MEEEGVKITAETLKTMVMAKVFKDHVFFIFHPF